MWWKFFERKRTPIFLIILNTIDFTGVRIIDTLELFAFMSAGHFRLIQHRADILILPSISFL